MSETHDGDEVKSSTSSPEPSEIHLVIKTAKDKETIAINPDATIEEVSETSL